MVMPFFTGRPLEHDVVERREERDVRPGLCGTQVERLLDVWIPDDATQTLRRRVARRAQIVRQRVRLKNEVHSVLHTYLIPRCPAADLCGRKGRAWLAAPPLPLAERLGVEQRLRELDRLGDDLKTMDRLLGEAGVDNRAVQQSLTITGVNAIVASGLWAAIGDITRLRRHS